MGIIVVLALLIVTLLCSALRALRRVVKPYVGHDAWAILLVVDQLKRGNGYDGVSRYFLIEEEHDYPPLFFCFFSLFPTSWLRKYNSMINPILDRLVMERNDYLLYEQIPEGSV